MATVDELSVKFSADMRELIGEMRRSEQATQAFREKVSSEMRLATAAFDRVGGEIKGIISGALSGIQTAGITAAIGLLTAAFIGLSEGTTKAKAAMDAANAALATGNKLASELASVTGELADQKKVEALATIALTESELTRMSIIRERLREEERGARSVQTQLSARDRGELIDKQIDKIKEQIRFTRLSIAAGEEAAAVAAGMRTNTGANANKPPAASIGPTKGESWLIRDAQAAIQASEALDEYQRRTVDARALAEAELSQDRERIALIELTQQLRKQYGTEFVRNQQEKIAAYATERAAVERSIDQQKRLMSELQALGTTFKGALGDSLVAVLEGGATGAEKLREAWRHALDDMSRRLLNFALDTAWDALRQQLRGIGGEGGGLLSQILGVITGSGAGAAAGAAGGGGGEVTASLAGYGGNVVGFAEGGNPPMNRWSLVGEEGPEWIRPRFPMTVLPNGTGPSGGGTINFYGSPDSTVQIGELAAGLRRLGHRVNVMQATEGQRVVGHVVDAKRRGGAAAGALG